LVNLLEKKGVSNEIPAPVFFSYLFPGIGRLQPECSPGANPHPYHGRSRNPDSFPLSGAYRSSTYFCSHSASYVDPNLDADSHLNVNSDRITYRLTSYPGPNQNGDKYSYQGANESPNSAAGLFAYTRRNGHTQYISSGAGSHPYPFARPKLEHHFASYNFRPGRPNFRTEPGGKSSG